MSSALDKHPVIYGLKTLRTSATHNATADANARESLLAQILRNTIDAVISGAEAQRRAGEAMVSGAEAQRRAGEALRDALRMIPGLQATNGEQGSSRPKASTKAPSPVSPLLV